MILTLESVIGKNRLHAVRWRWSRNRKTGQMRRYQGIGRSEEYKRWIKLHRALLAIQARDQGWTLHYTGPVAVQISIDASTRHDADAVIEPCHDLLEAAAIIANDRQISDRAMLPQRVPGLGVPARMEVVAI